MKISFMKIKTKTSNKIQIRKRLFLLSVLLAGLTVLSHAQTRSFKRGLGYNTLMTEDVEALSPGVSWGYNWGHSGSGNEAAFSTYAFEFVPMAWGGIDTTAIRIYLSSHPEIKYLLGFNEPNFRLQSNLTPSEAATQWPDIEKIADEFGLTTVGPAVNYSPDAPYQNPFKWYDEFFQACADCRVDHIAIHLYMPTMSAIKSNIEQFKKYNRPIWLTEFCAWENNTTLAAQKKFMIETLDYLETDPDVFRYAWFKERGWNNDHPYMQLLDPRQEGVLKDLGEVFVHMSSYDSLYYFSPEQTIPSEHYIRMRGISMEKTSDESGHINLCEFDGNDWVDYNIDIPETDEYNVSFRLAAEYPDDSEIKLSVDGREIGSLLFEKTDVGVWNTQQCNVSFNAGKQTVRMNFKRGGLKLNEWSITQSGLSVEKVSDAKMILFPNPATDRLDIQGQAANVVITVFDLSGKKLIEEKNNTSVDISALKTGIYTISVLTPEGEKTIHKVIKK
jgi:hypothetical protein